MVHFWRMEMENGEIRGRHLLDIPRFGEKKPGKSPTVYPRMDEDALHSYYTARPHL